MVMAEKVTADLKRSGLAFDDIFPRTLDDNIRNVCAIPPSVDGYAIPYYDISGKVLQFYRVRLFQLEPKYKQVKGSSNHLYYPHDFMDTFKAFKGRFVVLCEGEKKAALLNKLGIPAIAFGGVDSWSNRTLLIPKSAETVAGPNKNLISLKLPSAQLDEVNMTTLAIGFQDMVDLCLKHKTTFLICYDSDSPLGVSSAIQRAAAKLGYELRFKGFTIGQIRQVILPFIEGLDRTAVDDFILHPKGGLEKFLLLIEEVMKRPSAFPVHPNVREHINRQLQKPKLDRKQITNLSLSLITELDSRGQRMYSPAEKQMYYFDGKNRSLMKVDINLGDPLAMQEQQFGKMLYRDYGLSPAADDRLMKWFGAQFAGEEPVMDVEPHKVIARVKTSEDILRYQINDGQYIKVSGDVNEPYKIHANGTDNILFESGHVEEITAEEITEQLKKRHAEPLTMWWGEVLGEVRLKHKGKQSAIIALLYYISPWLYRWRGMQLPVEIITGESGSGKSTLMEIRLNILTGDAKLRNAPGSLKDWHASIASSGGLHVTDNVHLTDKNLKQQMSDELCRLITEPDPHIEMRKYFTEADLRRIRVDSVFAFTAIQQPFSNGDVMQRSMLLELDKDQGQAEFAYDSSWKEYQISKRGGRAAWVSHHLHVMHLFFAKVSEEWDPRYKAKHRLINMEQSLRILARVFGMDDTWIPEYLSSTTNEQVSKADWALEGLAAFADFVRHHQRCDKAYTAADIVTWASRQPDFEECIILQSNRSLGKYMATNKHNIRMICGISENGKQSNRMTFTIAANIRKAIPGTDAEPQKTRVMLVNSLKDEEPGYGEVASVMSGALEDIAVVDDDGEDSN